MGLMAFAFGVGYRSVAENSSNLSTALIFELERKIPYKTYIFFQKTTKGDSPIHQRASERGNGFFRHLGSTRHGVDEKARERRSIDGS
jgi:hypothetical protein